MGLGDTIEWLLQGDPAIRWQVLRDLLDAPSHEWQAERDKVGAGDDWAGKLVSLQDPDGTWGGGLYLPKWTSTTYTLLTLAECGLDSGHPEARRGAGLILDHILVGKADAGYRKRLETDLCVLGFWLLIGSTFMPEDVRLTAIGEYLMERQMPDGGWNCRLGKAKDVVHSSFHTTFNVLDGLRAAAGAGNIRHTAFRQAEIRALEFMLAHRLYRSDKTGEVINPKFTMLSHPVRWHYDVLRGLDYMRSTPEIHDRRLEDSIRLLESKRRSNGRWAGQNKHQGIVFFDMEKTGCDSRWNTLRALRVLKARKG